MPHNSPWSTRMRILHIAIVLLAVACAQRTVGENGQKERRPRMLEKVTMERAIEISKEDAHRLFTDEQLASFNVRANLVSDGWHVDFELKDIRAEGGGPHYLIHPVTGAILRRQVEE